jgi:hypothetical protein
MTPYRLPWLSLVLALGCAHAAPTAPPPEPPPGPPRLEFVPGARAESAAASCSPVSWSGSLGDPVVICLDASKAIEVPRSAIYSTRIEDRTVDGRTWYLVSVFLTQRFQNRLREAFELPSGDAPYAVSIGGRVSFAYHSGVTAGNWPVLVSESSDLASSEQIARAWGTPVERMLSQEIAEQPVLVATMVQLLATPERWFGKRLVVQGFLPHSGELYLSREHAQAADASSVLLLGPRSEEEESAWSECVGAWVEVTGFADRNRGGTIDLTRIEKIRSIPKNVQCWPPPDSRRPRRPSY